MKLVLRSTASSNATWFDRLFARLTRWRLCSQWCHGAIVIGDTLYQSNAKNGLHATTDFEPAKWTLIDLGPDGDKGALNKFAHFVDAPYDWLGVLGFVIPWLPGQRWRMYCFEWCALAMGAPRARWQTPERLLAHIVDKGERT
jgi:hypothetical protein